MTLKRFNSLILLLCLFSSGVFAQQDENFMEPEVTMEQASQKIRDVISVLTNFVTMAEQGVPASLLSQAQGIIVIPNMIKIGFAFGGKGGNGIAVVRNCDERTSRCQWSNPSFVNIAGASFGWQIGAQSSDVILIFDNKDMLNKMTSGQFTLGADAAVAAGPIGRKAEAATDLQLSSSIYSYSHSKGLFAGVSLEGSALDIDHISNKTLYGQKVSPEQIFSGQVETQAWMVRKLKRILNALAD